MENLITTVRERYGHAVSYRGLMTLAYHGKAEAKSHGTEAEEHRKRGFLGFLSPQIQSVSKKLHEEVKKLLERRDKLLLQTVSKDIPQIVGKNTERLRSDSQKFAKTQTDKTVRLEKRVELITAETGAKLKSVERELERLKKEERNRAREKAQAEREQLFTARSIRQKENREQREREELLREISIDIIKTECRITRKLRDEEEYEKRRRGLWKMP